MKKQLLIAIGILISIVAIYFSLIGINWSELPLAFSRMKLAYAIFIIPFFYLIFFIRAYRWKIILPESSQQSLEDVFDATILGFFATNILPLRAGEFIRPWLYSKWSNLKMLTCLASVIVERVFDVLALMLILGISFSQISLPENLSFIIIGAKALILVALVISFVMLIAYLKPDLLDFFVKKFCEVFLDKKFKNLSEKIKTLSLEFIQGLKSINGYKEFLLVILSSIALWVSMSLLFQFVLWLFDPSAELIVGFVLTAVIALAVAAPSAPGFIGTYQFGCVFALCEIFNYSKELAIALSLVAHLSQYLINFIHGVYILKKRNLSLKVLTKAES